MVEGIVLIILGFGWLICKILKEEVFNKPAAPNTDYRKAGIDLSSGKISKKEYDRRLTSGYYSKKK